MVHFEALILSISMFHFKKWANSYILDPQFLTKSFCQLSKGNIWSIENSYFLGHLCPFRNITSKTEQPCRAHVIFNQNRTWLITDYILYNISLTYLGSNESMKLINKIIVDTYDAIIYKHLHENTYLKKSFRIIHYDLKLYL